MWRGRFSFLIFLLCIYPYLASAAPWVNPRVAVGDPMIARLPFGRKALTEIQKEEIRRYGFTGLEIMIYVFANEFAGHDWDWFSRITNIGSQGQILNRTFLKKRIYYYKSLRDLLLLNGIRPGDRLYKEVGIFLGPPDSRYNGFVSYLYLTSDEQRYEEDDWFWDSPQKKIRRSTFSPKDNPVTNSDLTSDDYHRRRPWGENHTILGEDTFQSKSCLVIESIACVEKNYYLSKRVSWIEKENFLPLHEEQFDRQGRLFRIIEKRWERVKPWNYWNSEEWNIVSLDKGSQTVYLRYDVIFDQGLKDSAISIHLLKREQVWREDNHAPPEIRMAADFPPRPQVQWSFWERIGKKPELAK